jgi:dTMP kinase
MRGALIAFEGIDQAGKLTQARLLAERVRAAGRACALLHYPDYDTPIGRILQQALCEGLELDARARTMLFAANRWENDAVVRRHVDQGAMVLIDRYSASNIVYGLSQGYERRWLESLEEGLTPADVTVFVDITPEESERRKQSGRDDFERNAALLAEARRQYLEMSRQQGWLLVDGTLTTDKVADGILKGLRQRLSGKGLDDLLARDA